MDLASVFATCARHYAGRPAQGVILAADGIIAERAGRQCDPGLACALADLVVAFLRAQRHLSAELSIAQPDD